ncbi:hypothetical protein [Klebsiella pneumoniae]|uniref:hypothetical protein n=1 Tax=Klebsiella pneumoniae TaxID=573 RepID=UPI00388EBEBD
MTTSTSAVLDINSGGGHGVQGADYIYQSREPFASLRDSAASACSKIIVSHFWGDWCDKTSIRRFGVLTFTTIYRNEITKIATTNH